MCSNYCPRSDAIAPERSQCATRDDNVRSTTLSSIAPGLWRTSISLPFGLRSRSQCPIESSQTIQADPNRSVRHDHATRAGQKRPLLYEAIDLALVANGETEMRVLRELLAPLSSPTTDADAKSAPSYVSSFATMKCHLMYPIMLSHLHVGIRRAARTGGTRGLRIMKMLHTYLQKKLFHEFNVLIPELQMAESATDDACVDDTKRPRDRNISLNQQHSIRGVTKTIWGLLLSRTDDDSAREGVCDFDILKRRKKEWTPANVDFTFRDMYERDAKLKSGVSMTYFPDDSIQTPLEIFCASGDENSVRWMLESGAVADIDSEILRIKVAAARHCARLHARNQIRSSEELERTQDRETSTVLRRHSLLLRTLLGRQSRAALTLLSATRSAQQDGADPIPVLCPTVAALRNELYVTSKYALKLCSFFVGQEAMSLEVREQYSYPPMRLFRRVWRQAESDLSIWYDHNDDDEKDEKDDDEKDDSDDDDDRGASRSRSIGRTVDDTKDGANDNMDEEEEEGEKTKMSESTTSSTKKNATKMLARTEVKEHDKTPDSVSLSEKRRVSLKIETAVHKLRSSMNVAASSESLSTSDDYSHIANFHLPHISRDVFRSYVEMLAILIEALERLQRRIAVASEGGRLAVASNRSSIVSPSSSRRRKRFSRSSSSSASSATLYPESRWSIDTRILAEALLICARQGQIDVVRRILDMIYGIRSQSFTVTDVVDYRGHHKGITPLMAASMHGHVAMVELFLKNSANTEISDHANGWTALHHAARELQPQVVRMLIENGATPTSADRFGRLPIHLVYRPNNTYRYMLNDAVASLSSSGYARHAYRRRNSVSDVSLEHDAQLMLLDDIDRDVDDATLASIANLRLGHYPSRARHIAARAAAIAMTACTAAIVAVTAMSNKPFQTTLTYLRQWVRSKIAKQSLVRFRKKRTGAALLPANPDHAQKMLNTLDMYGRPPIPALYWFTGFNPGFREWQRIAHFAMLKNRQKSKTKWRRHRGRGRRQDSGGNSSRRHVRSLTARTESQFDETLLSTTSKSSTRRRLTSSPPTTPIAHMMPSSTRNALRLNDRNVSARTKVGTMPESLAQVTMITNRRHRGGIGSRAKQRRESVATLAMMLSGTGGGSPMIEDMSSMQDTDVALTVDPSSKSDDDEVGDALDQPMVTTTHHAITTSRNIAAETLSSMTTAGSAMTRTKERSPVRRMSKLRVGSFHIADRQQRRLDESRSSETKIESISSSSSRRHISKSDVEEVRGRLRLNSELSSAGNSGGCDESNSRGPRKVNVPTHVLPQERLFGDPEIQWVIEEYWGRLTVRTRTWLFVKNFALLLIAVAYAVVDVGPISGLITGQYVTEGVASRFLSEEFSNSPPKYFYDIDDLEELYEYMDKTMYNALFDSGNAIGASSPLYERVDGVSHIATFNRLLGSVRLRVVRNTDSTPCGGADGGASDALVGSGYRDAGNASSDAQVCFGGNGAGPGEEIGDVLAGVAPNMTWSDGSGNEHLFGYSGGIPRDGYVLDVPSDNGTIARESLSELKLSNVVDTTTRALIVQFTSYNAFENVMVHGNLLFEFGMGGIVMPSSFFRSFSVPSEFFTWHEMLFVSIFTMPLVLKWCRDALSEGLRFEPLRVKRYMAVLGIVVSANHFQIWRNLDDVHWDDAQMYMVKASPVTSLSVTTLYVLGFLVLTVFVEFFSILTFMNSSLAMTVLIIWRMIRLLLGLLTLFLMVIVAFSFTCYIIFHRASTNFQTIPSAVFSGWLGALAGDLGTLNMRRWGTRDDQVENRGTGFVESVVMIAFLLLMVLVLINFIIALMNDEYSAVKKRAATHWASLQAKMLVAASQESDGTLRLYLWTVRWLLINLYDDDEDDEWDDDDEWSSAYESNRRTMIRPGSRRSRLSTSSHRYRSSDRRHRSRVELFRGRHDDGQRTSCCSTLSDVRWWACRLCCCKSRFRQFLVFKQHDVLSEFAHRKKISTTSLSTSVRNNRYKGRRRTMLTRDFVSCVFTLVLFDVLCLYLCGNYAALSVLALIAMLIICHVLWATNVPFVVSSWLTTCSSFRTMRGRLGKMQRDVDSSSNVSSGATPTRSVEDSVTRVADYHSDGDEENEEGTSSSEVMVRDAVDDGRVGTEEVKILVEESARLRVGMTTAIVTCDSSDEETDDRPEKMLPIPRRRVPSPSRLPRSSASSQHANEVELTGLPR